MEESATKSSSFYGDSIYRIRIQYLDSKILEPEVKFFLKYAICVAALKAKLTMQFPFPSCFRSFDNPTAIGCIFLGELESRISFYINPEPHETDYLYIAIKGGEIEKENFKDFLNYLFGLEGRAYRLYAYEAEMIT